MSWNIKTPGDYINGPLTVVGVGQFNSSVGIGIAPSAYRFRVLAGFGSGIGGAYIEAGEFNQKTLVINNTNPSVSANLFEAQKNGSAVFSLNANAALILSGGNASANGVGVAFPIAQSASTDANTLDDYEEGTWTPVVTAGTGTLTSVTGQAGAYTKVGRMVIATCFFTVATNGTGGSFISVSGLPFANGNLTNIGIGRIDGTTGNLFQGKLNNGASAINLWKYDNTYPAADGAQFPMTITYYV
jgi:hypothetical protein